MLWLHSERKEDRNHALIETKTAVAFEESHFGDLAWTNLYEDAVIDDDGRKEVSKATLRSFRTEHITGKTIQSLLTVVCDLRPAHELDEARRKNLIPRQVLVASIAAWRTKACMNDARGLDVDDIPAHRALGWQFNYLS